MREYAPGRMKWLLVALCAVAQADTGCAEPCSNGGLCLPRIEDATVSSCFCPPGWTGPGCTDSLNAVVTDAAPETPAAPAAATVAETTATQPATQVVRPASLVTAEAAPVRTGSMRGAIATSASPTNVLAQEEQVDDLLRELKNGIADIQAQQQPQVAALKKAVTVKKATVQQKAVTGAQTAVRRQTPEADGVQLPYVTGTVALVDDAEHPIDSASFTNFFPLILWHTLSDLYVTKDDIAVENVDPATRKITFTITPHHPESNVDEIATRLTEEIGADGSDLRELLPNLDPSLSVVTTTGVSTPPGSGGEVTPLTGVTPLSSDSVKAQAAGGAVEITPPVVESGPPPTAAEQAKATEDAKWEKLSAGPTIPISTTLHCIIALTVQFFAVHTLIELADTANRCSSGKLGGVVPVVKACEETVSYAPMLAILFLGTRMRALQLGVEPQDHVKQAMEVCMYAVLGCTVMACLEKTLGAFLEKLGGVIGIVKLLIIFSIYGGAGTVVHGILSMEANPEEWPDGPPPVAPAMQATVILLAQYFIIKILYLIFDTLKTFGVMATKDKNPIKDKVLPILNAGVQTVNFAPMLAVLFIGTRMRALQIDPKAVPGSGVPQEWVQTCFYVCAYAVLIQTILAILIPIVFSAMPTYTDRFENDPEPAIGFEFPESKKTIAGAVKAIQILVMLGMYGATGAIVYGNIIMVDPKTNSAPPLAPSMVCVTILTCQFFFVYLGLQIILLVQDYGKMKLNKTLTTVVKMTSTVTFAPMLCVLFLGARMRAQEITDNLGAPQGWVQECMFASTFALIAKLVVLAIKGTFGEMNALAVVFDILNLLVTVCLYGGVVLVCAGVLIMEPMVLDGTGGYVYYKL